MVAQELLKILVCPKCRGGLKYELKKQELVCPRCLLAYRIEDDIPVMLIEEARPIAGKTRSSKKK